MTNDMETQVQGKKEEVAQAAQSQEKEGIKKEAEKNLSPIEEGRAIAERIEKGNVELKELLNKQEKLIAEQRLSGKGFAGIQNTPKEETPKEYAERVMRGEVK